MFSKLVLAFYLAFCSLTFASALPHREGLAIAHRQVASTTLAAPLTAPTTFTTTNTIQT
jgi:hypothetical protein